MHSLDQADELEPLAKRREGRQMPLWQELPLLLVVAFCVAVLVRTFLVQMFFIPSGSMEDTLRPDDRVLVNKVVYQVREPERGEVVVFRGPPAWDPQLVSEPEQSLVGKVGRTLADLVGVSQPGEKDFIKRVIGIPGDRVMCCDEQGRVTVNGVPLDETYVIRDSPQDLPPSVGDCRSRRFDEVVVPPGHLFVMGDHRLESKDSRCQGTVPIDNVIGRAFVVVWPPDRWTTLSVPPTFEDVSKASAAPADPIVPPGRPERTGGAVIVVPVLASLLARTGSGTHRRASHRKLHP